MAAHLLAGAGGRVAAEGGGGGGGGHAQRHQTNCHGEACVLWYAH